MAEQDYDVSNVVKAFLNEQYPQRADLIKHFRQEINDTPACKALLAEVAQKAMEHQLGPVAVLGCGLMYGMALGVLMEKDRTERSRRRN